MKRFAAQACPQCGNVFRPVTKIRQFCTRACANRAMEKPHLRGCSRCEYIGPRESFPLADSKGHRRGYCKECDRKRLAARRAKDSQPTQLSNRRWAERNSDRMLVMRRAKSTITNAIRRGKLVRPRQCEQCSIVNVPIEAAHFDYAQPLSVRWLCRSCHRRWDRAQPKTLEAAR